MKREFRLKDRTKLNIGDVDRILYESYEPILFTTKNNKNEIFICVSASDKKDKKVWLLRKTTPQIIIELLSDKITIRNAFLKSIGTKYTINLTNEYEVLENDLVSWSEGENSLLPVNEVMEVEENEFEEELLYFQALNMQILENIETSYEYDGYITVSNYKQKVVSKFDIDVQVDTEVVKRLNSALGGSIDNYVNKEYISKELKYYNIYSQHHSYFQLFEAAFKPLVKENAMFEKSCKYVINGFDDFNGTAA